MEEYIINPCSGIKIEVNKGQSIDIIDIEGGQVVDFLLKCAMFPQNFYPRLL